MPCARCGAGVGRQMFAPPLHKVNTSHVKPVLDVTKPLVSFLRE